MIQRRPFNEDLREDRITEKPKEDPTLRNLMRTLSLRTQKLQNRQWLLLRKRLVWLFGDSI